MTNETFKDIEKLEADLWEAADNLGANSKLTSSDYFMPVLGIICLRHAANRFEAACRQIAADQASGKMPKRKVFPADYIAIVLRDSPTDPNVVENDSGAFRRVHLIMRVLPIKLVFNEKPRGSRLSDIVIKGTHSQQQNVSPDGIPSDFGQVGHGHGMLIGTGRLGQEFLHEQEIVNQGEAASFLPYSIILACGTLSAAGA